MTPVERFRREHPGLFFLDPADRAGLEHRLRTAGLLDAGERVETVAKAGEGNMNCTVRVRTTLRSFIVKQARPWVEKYPQFEAPWERIAREHEFYRRVETVPALAERMPHVLHFDPDERWMVLEDLGEAGDYTDLYSGVSLTTAEVGTLADFLTVLHSLPLAYRAPLENRAMRELNHAHIFDIPLRRENGLNLDGIAPGLQAAADRLKSDDSLVHTVADLGRTVYLAPGRTLIHGDYFPGSLMRTRRGPFVIDPEFGHDGRAEFDVGVWLAHMVMAGQTGAVVEDWRARYRGSAGFDEILALQLAGVEMIRRLIGYAQLPLRCDPARRLGLLETGAGLVRAPGWAALHEGLAKGGITC